MVKKIIILLCIVLIASGLYIFVWKDKNINNQSNDPNKPLYTLDAPEKTQFKEFTPQEFSDLYNSFAYPNTQPIQNDFSITGNIEADQVIYEIAESMGYKIRSAPVSNNLISVDGEHLLQREAAQSWKSLKKAAANAGIDIKVVQGYRSAQDQNEIFSGRFGNIKPEKIIDRSSDEKIKQILLMTAPPGYSRHHTGYTVDLACDSDTGVKFENSNCYEWINKDNYINIKKFGWIPSYPEGIKNQGPDPESWEYVWVGLDAVKE